jgi:urease subunit beta
MIPGELFVEPDPIVINAGLEATTQQVRNAGDRPIQVGSHFHFFEVNSALEFDRESTRNKRLDIASGTAVRFEPGQTKTVALIEFASQKPLVPMTHSHRER